MSNRNAAPMRFLRDWREAKGMSAAELAEKTGVDPAYIASMEGGRRVNPSSQFLLGCAEALGVDVTALTSGPPSAGPITKPRKQRPRPDDRSQSDATSPFSSLTWREFPGIMAYLEKWPPKMNLEGIAAFLDFTSPEAFLRAVKLGEAPPSKETDADGNPVWDRDDAIEFIAMRHKIRPTDPKGVS